MARLKAERVFLMQQHSNDDGRGKRVRDVGRNRDANDAGIENGDRDYVEYHVEQHGGSERVQRASGVAFRAQHSRAEIVRKEEYAAREIDAQVPRGLFGCLGGHADGVEDRSGNEHSNDGKQGAAYKREHGGRLHRVLHEVHAPVTDSNGDCDVRAD